jgi:hypothetical protein
LVKMVGRSAIAGIFLSVSITFLVISHFSLPKGHQTVLQSSDECMPCSSGSEDMCHAGCLTNAGIRARLLSVKTLQQQLSVLKHAKKAKAPTISLASLPTETNVVGPVSIETAKRDISRENAELLHLGTKNAGGLGQILNSAQKNLLRAEAAEVRLRRQAKLHKGKKQTIMDVFEHLRLASIAFHFSNAEPFRSRKRTYTRLLAQSSRQATFPTPRPRVRACPPPSREVSHPRQARGSFLRPHAHSTPRLPSGTPPSSVLSAAAQVHRHLGERRQGHRRHGPPRRPRRRPRRRRRSHAEHGGPSARAPPPCRPPAARRAELDHRHEVRPPAGPAAQRRRERRHSAGAVRAG